MKPTGFLLTRAAALVALAVAPLLRADVVTDWNAAFEASLLNPAERGPRLPIRTWAIMHVAMFDAVNGIVRKYEPCHVTEKAPPGARAEAAAIQAAYATLSALRPAFQSAYDAQLQTSLDALPGEPGNSESIARGRAWGNYVAQQIIAWRATDGSSNPPPTYNGPATAGYWLHAPIGGPPMAGLDALGTTPFVLPLAELAAFDPGPPYGIADRVVALQSAPYAADVNESKARGGAVSAVRTADEAAHALFNDGCDPASLNRLMRSLVSPHASLVENARAFALLNLTPFDARVLFYHLKYQYGLWRPFQAIKYASEVPNAAIVPDPNWTSLLPTPRHPEYPSAHVTLFSSMLRVMTSLVGDGREVLLYSSISTEPRTYPSLAAISDATVECRINIGYHFRQTCDASQIIGRHLGDYLVTHALTPARQ